MDLLTELTTRAEAIGAIVSPTSHGWIVSYPFGYGGMRMYRSSFTLAQLAEHVLELEHEALERLANVGNVHEGA